MTQNRHKIFFVSDVHLGVPNAQDSLVRERKLIRWMDEVAPEAAEIILLGDIFDFWYEYKHVVPRGYVRILGKIADLKDRGIKVSFFVGNHDIWAGNYFEKELQIEVHHHPIQRIIGNKKFYIGHGDGLGPGDYGYKLLKKLFTCKICQWFFSRLHPNFAFGLANFFSAKSREAHQITDQLFESAEKELLVQYSREVLEKEHYDYFIFGHRHLPMTHQLNSNSMYLNTGDWIRHFTYAEFDGEHLRLKHY